MRFGRLALLAGLVTCVASVLYVARALSDDERAAQPLDALVASGDIGRARDLTEGFRRRYPSSDYCHHIEALTGAHPRPSIPGK